MSFGKRKNDRPRHLVSGPFSKRQTMDFTCRWREPLNVSHGRRLSGAAYSPRSLVSRVVQESSELLQKPVSISNYQLLLKNKTNKLAKYLTKIQTMYDNGVISETLAYLRWTPVILADSGEEEARLIGHDLRDLIVRCRFRGRTCNMRHFSQIPNPLFGNCYRFDPGELGADYAAIGPSKGLSVMFYLEATNLNHVKVEYRMVYIKAKFV